MMETELSHYTAFKKMCTYFITDVIWMNTMCAVSLANYLRAVADAHNRKRY